MHLRRLLFQTTSYSDLYSIKAVPVASVTEATGIALQSAVQHAH